MVRLQKFLSSAGIASRRKAEKLIEQGLVTVNGRQAQLGSRVDPKSDVVLVEGKRIKAKEKVYYLLNKPHGVITTCSDSRGRTTVIDLLPDSIPGIHPVGRLDYNSEGLLLLTNDGDLTYILTHPRFQVPKTYQVLLRGKPEKADINRLEKGILLEDGLTAPAKVRIIGHQNNTATLMEITIHEGRNRQVRRMCDKIGHGVLKLRRTGLAFLTLGNLQPGDFRTLSKKELKRLWQLG